MRRLEKILLSKVPLWIVVVILVLTVAGAVVFGAIVKEATKLSVLDFDDEGFLGLGSVAIEIAEIPGSLLHLSSEAPLGEARSQRFDGRAGLDFADTVRSSEEGYLLLVRNLPSPASGRSMWKNTALFELIDLSRRTTAHVWSLNLGPGDHFAYVLPGGSLIVMHSRVSVARLDACSNVEWTKRWNVHHSIERDADGDFWAPATGDRAETFREEDGLLEFSPSGEILTRIWLSDALVRGGYRHLFHDMYRYTGGSLHINDVQPVLRDGPFWRRGDLFISMRNPSVVLLYRPATDEVVWLRAGPWMHQHDVDVVSESEISVFSNNAGRTSDGRLGVLGANEVYVYDFATGEARSPWREAMRRHDVRTATMGGATLLGDGGGGAWWCRSTSMAGSWDCRPTVRDVGRTSTGRPTVRCTGSGGAATWMRSTVRRSHVRLRLPAARIPVRRRAPSIDVRRGSATLDGARRPYRAVARGSGFAASPG